MYRYSDRLAWISPENSFSQLLAELRLAGRPLLDLTISNPTGALADYPHAEISSAFGSLSNFRYEPESLGNREAREVLAERMRVSASQIALTASTSEAYSILFKLLANPGDEVLVPTPSYPLFEYLARLECINLRPYHLAYDGSWYIDFDSMEAAINTRTRALILVHPNNPTGSFVKLTEFSRLRELAIRHSLPLISDEVFLEYAIRPSAERMATLAAQNDVLNFSLNGLSKASGMPQMKLAWLTISGPPAEREKACARLELLLDTYLPVGTPVQLALKNLLAIGDSIRHRIQTRLEYNLQTLAGLLEDTHTQMLHLEGGWSAILRVPNLINEDQWLTRLACEHNVIVQPGYFFDMPGEPYLIVSLLTEKAAFQEGITRIRQLGETIQS